MIKTLHCILRFKQQALTVKSKILTCHCYGKLWGWTLKQSAFSQRKEHQLYLALQPQREISDALAEASGKRWGRMWDLQEQERAMITGISQETWVLDFLFLTVHKLLNHSGLKSKMRGSARWLFKTSYPRFPHSSTVDILDSVDHLLWGGALSCAL